MIKIQLKNGKLLEFEKPVKIKELVNSNNYDFFACKVNNKLRDFEYTLTKDCTVEFVDFKDNDASRVYESSLRFVVLMATYLVDKSIQLKATFGASRSTFFFRTDGKPIDEALFKKIHSKMNEIIHADYSFTRSNVSIAEAKRIYQEFNYLDKLDLLKYRPENQVHIYDCDGYKNYLYSYMVPSTKYLTRYNVLNYDDGIVLLYPRSELHGEIPTFVEEKTYSKTLKDTRYWGKINSSSTVEEINQYVISGREAEFALSCENKHNRMLEELANRICSNPKIALIAIAGPSSSGKTTFSNRLRVKLMEKGINPVVISMDDYYIDRDLFDFDSVTDFEDINLLDIPLFNENMRDLINGREVELPKFDFLTKKRVRGPKMKLDKRSPIIIEGIHALNKKATALIPAERKFKIYIGPQIQVNLDNHNPISLTNVRLIRRIVRDYQFRGASAEKTLGMWESVRNGEFKWIYENQEGVDYVFNSELDYELCITKKHVLPLLKAITCDSEFYNLANTLIKYVKYFKDIDDQYVPSNSLLREFIGGSCFNV